jgi:DNA-binding NtrC family response regulator
MTKQESILIVDDEIGPRESLRRVLQPIYQIYTAENGKEALECVQNKKIDLVTLDLNMPGLSGFDVLREIKKINADIEVILITGHGTLPNVQEAIRYGAGDFISKPYSIADIIATVSKSFARRNYNLKVRSMIQEIKNLRNEEEKEVEELGRK